MGRHRDLSPRDRRQAGDHGFSERFADRVHPAPRAAGDADTVTLRLFLDAASIELFADGGATVMTEVFFPSVPFDRFALHAEGAPVLLRQGRFCRLEGIWRR